MVLKVSLQKRGFGTVVRSYKSLRPKISNAQKRAGMKSSTLLVREAQKIIRQKAPKSSGFLRSTKNFHKQVDELSRGWKFTITNTAPYAKKVESGHPQERVRVDAKLKDWAKRVLGPDALKVISRKKTIVVRKGNNPKYDTTQGMGFFRIPVTKHQQKIVDMYETEINKVIESFKK